MMLGRATLLVSLLLLLGASFSCRNGRDTPPAPQPDLSAEEKAIRALDRQYAQAIQAHDMARLRPLLADDIISLTHKPDRARVDGIQDVQSLTDLYFKETNNLAITTQPEKVVIARSGDLAFLLGTYEAKFDSPTGPRVDSGRYLFALRKIDDAWKVIIHTGRAGIWDPPRK